MRRRQHLASIAEQLKAVLRHDPLFEALVLHKGMYVTGESEGIKSVLSEM